MLIGIDGNEANVEKRVGVGEYAYELLWQFVKLKVKSLKFKVYLKEKPLGDLPKETGWWKYKVVRPRKLWTQIGLPLALYKDCRYRGRRVDVFFTPSHYAPRFCPSPTVISIMDLSYLHFPEMFKKSDFYQLKNWTAYSVKKSGRILTISQASKNDIIKYYQVPKERVVVTYPGYKEKLKVKSLKFKVEKMKQDLKRKYAIEGEYLLFVGTLQPRKNVVRLIQAFSTLNPNSYTLVIVGKPGWMYEEIYEAPKKFGVEGRVKFLGYVADSGLPTLYQNALCFVLPSLYEGFGLPVLEAMANGCPVVISNTSSLPEVGGEAAIYVDPQSVESIKEGILKVLNLTPKARQDLIKEGYAQAKKFSWEKCARETLKVLEEVAKKRY